MKELMKLLLAFGAAFALSLLVVGCESNTVSDVFIPYYSATDILYVNPHTLEISTESGDTRIQCKSWEEVANWVDHWSSVEVNENPPITDDEVWNLLSNYTAVYQSADHTTVNIINPYSNEEFELEMNTVDSIDSNWKPYRIYYFID